MYLHAIACILSQKQSVVKRAPIFILPDGVTCQHYLMYEIANDRFNNTWNPVYMGPYIVRTGLKC